MTIPSRQNIVTDVVIVGAGAAGARAAIEAARGGARVVMLSKGIAGRTGITPLSSRSFAVPLHPDDSPDRFLSDVLTGGRGLSDRRLARAMVFDSRRAYDDLIEFGVAFERQGDRPRLLHQPGQSVPRSALIRRAGQGLVAALIKEIKRHPSVTIMNDCFATRVAVVGGEVSGVAAIDLVTGQPVGIGARAVILATGGNEQLWPFADTGPDSVGDGFAIGYEAGATLIDMEEVLFYPTVALDRRVRGSIIIYDLFINPALAGGRIINVQGKEIYPPGPPPPRDILVQAMAREIREGRGSKNGGLYLDLSASPKGRNEIMGWIKKSHRFAFLMQMGLDPLKEPIEVAPACHHTLGGIRIDDRGQSSVSGLFAAGECAGNVHGANRTSGNGLLDAVVFGARAGRRAAMEAKRRKPPQAPSVAPEAESLSKWLGDGRHGPSPVHVKDGIKEIMGMFVGLKRREDGLNRALSRLLGLRGELDRMRVTGPRNYNLGIVDALEAVFMAAGAEMVIRSALARKETRGHHIRVDYPYEVKGADLFHTLITKMGTEMHVETVPIGDFGKE